MATFPAAHPGTESNCIGCHMPRRDAQDGGHTAFTDHRIQRRPEAQPDGPPAQDIAAWREPAPDLQKRNLGIAYVSAGLQRRSTTSLVRGYRLLTEVQNEFSSDPEVFTSMGTALLVGKQPSEAEFAFERALSLRPNSAMAETNAAAAHQQAGDIDGTIAHLERAVALDPLHLPAASALINLYQQQRNPAKANELSEKVRGIMEEQPGQGQSGPAQLTPVSTSSSPKMAEAVFKNLKVLNGIPSEQLIPGMRFITSSLGVQCSFCHVEGRFDDDAKKEKQIGRSMMRMMFAINQNHFEGTREVTCYSCHRGAPRPIDVPPVAGEMPSGEASAVGQKFPSECPFPISSSTISFKHSAGPLHSRKSQREWRREAHRSVENRLASKFSTREQTRSCLSSTLRLGRALLLWTATLVGSAFRTVQCAISAAPIFVAQADADLQFALHIKQIFPELRVEYPEAVDGRETYVVVGTREGQPSWKFFFDVQSGLLVRLVRYAESPLGLDPTQIDYRDYRAVDGVQTPFTWTIARPGSRSTIYVNEIQQNVPIGDEKFLKPSAKTDNRSQAPLTR